MFKVVYSQRKATFKEFNTAKKVLNSQPKQRTQMGAYADV